MIIQNYFNVEGRDFIRTTSDAGRYVVRDGVSYSEACDPAEFNRQYTEGDPLPPDELSNQTSSNAVALTRYVNELTGQQAETLTEATETLIKIVKGES